ncbi:MAG: hypothetical protein ACI8Z1_002566 [Candidatus Azotimanducaceae bacterium]|jgi:hypothetical protein
MTKLTSPSGLVSNTNCVRRGAVHNLEGFDSPNNTFVRFINTGTSTISNITGRVKSADGSPTSSNNVTFLEGLSPNEAIWLNRSKLSDLIGKQWNGIASLEVDTSDENLKLLNLNFVNGETFFNFSCYEKNENPITTQAFF